MGLFSAIASASAPVKSALIGAGASLLGGAASTAASAKQARLNREFQERMSNTAFQRSAADLEAAGLNRVLALGSPASTPGGAMAQVPNYGSTMAQGAQAGLGIVSTAQDIQQSKATVDKLVQETRNLSEIERKLAQQSNLWETMAPIIEDAGNNFNNLLAMITDGGFMSYIGNIVKDAALEEIEGLKKVMMQKFDQSQEVIDGWWNKVEGYPHNTGRTEIRGDQSWLNQ